MSAYIFTDRGLCFKHEGAPEWRALNNLLENENSSEGEVSVLLSSVEYRVVNSVDLERKEFSILPEGYVIRQERLKGGKSLVMGVRIDLLSRVYAAFPSATVKACIPYGIAVRSLLLTRGILNENGVYLVVEDAGTVILMTALSGFMIIETREIAFRDVERLIEEVKRSEKLLFERTASRGIIQIVSNHLEFLQALKKQRPADEIITIEEVLPVFSVLTKARFGIHFPSPAQEAAGRQRENMRQCLLHLALPVCSVIVSVSFAMVMKYLVVQASGRLENLNGKISHKEAIFKSRWVNTYQGQLRASKKFSWEESFSDLLASIPAGWKLENIVWESGLKRCSKVTALILNNSEEAFDGQGILKQALVSHEISNGRPAVRIIYEK